MCVIFNTAIVGLDEALGVRRVMTGLLLLRRDEPHFSCGYYALN